jgi:hypothetical protein
MNRLQSFFICFLVPVLSLNSLKLCKNCHFYKRDFFSKEKFGKCSQFPSLETNDYFLVDGKGGEKEIYDYMYCSVARKFESMCGEEGKYYSESEKKGSRKYK